MKWYKTLLSSKGRKESGVFLVEGPRALHQIHAVLPEYIQEILIDETSVPMPIPGFCGNIRKVNAQQIASISQSKTPQGICGVVAMPTQVYSAELPENCGRKIVLLEEIQDPGNVGTLIRSAAAFNFTGVLLSETCADPFSPKAVQASAGSLLSVWIRRTAEYIPLASALKENGFTIIAADIRGTISPEPLEKKKLVLALGNEGKGISQAMRDLADTVFTIPYNTEAVESLNVASAGAISMFLVNRENAR